MLGACLPPASHSPRTSCRSSSRADRPVVLLKGGPGVAMPPLTDANVNLNAIMYIRSDAASSSGGGGLSAGAIAGVTVGACLAVALPLAGVAGVICVRRRRRRQREQQQHLAAHSKAQQTQVLAVSEVSWCAGL